MFEFDQNETKDQARFAAVDPVGAYEPVPGIRAMSFLMWGEHCTECAAPDCFATCDLYKPRPDGMCRRFAHGVYRNKNFKTMRGYGAEIVFKKWGKLEARGNTCMEVADKVLRRERMVEWCAPIVSAAGSVVAKIIRNKEFGHATRALLERYQRRKHRRYGAGAAPSAFLIEIYNPSDSVVDIQFRMGVARAELNGVDITKLPPPFATNLELPPGYSRHEIDLVLFRSVTESGLPFDLSFVPAGDQSIHLVFLTADFVTYEKPASTTTGRPDAKCVVFDLDNTFWNGVLLENEDVRLRDGLVDTLRTLDERGILLSIASKNSHDHAWRKLEEFGIAEYFLYPKINWIPKSENIRQIAKDLNIGLDTFIFVDDNPFELEQVQDAIPDVACVSDTAIGTLVDDPRLKGSSSREAAGRRRLYQDAVERDNAMTGYGGDYLAFLASCDIRLEISDYQDDDLERAAELVQRTNQLNFSGRKYSRDQIQEVLEDRQISKFMLNCSDKFGSYGMVGIGIVVADGPVLRVQDFMLSCRVQGKFVEQAFFGWIVRHARFGAPKRLWINFHKTEKNQPAQQVLDAIGFASVDGESGLSFDLSRHALTCDFIHVGEHDPAHGPSASRGDEAVPVTADAV